MILQNNILLQHLKDAGLLDESNLSDFHTGTRDISEINILIDKETGALFTDKTVTNLHEYYVDNKHYVDGTGTTIVEDKYIESPILQDDIRRVEAFADFMQNKKILDFGCGKGGFLKHIRNLNLSNELFGVELNKVNRTALNELQIHCTESLDELKNEQFDLIFSHHVFEHLDNPVFFFNTLLSLIKEDGTIVIEVPHGNDILIKQLGCDPFRNFTFWSEHLCLYTGPMFDKVMTYLGVKDYSVAYFQRYNINNHFHWILNSLPGGHERFHGFTDESIREYNNVLRQHKVTDTLFLIIGKGHQEMKNALMAL